MSTVFQCKVSLGGNGNYYSGASRSNADDGTLAHPYGLANGGQRDHFDVVMNQFVTMADFTVQTSATNATAAGASATAAAASAASAVASAGTQASSSTSMTLGAGTGKTLTITTGKLFVPKQWVVIFRTSDPTKAEYAQLQTHNSGTGVITFDTLAGNVMGSGTFTDWTVAHTGPQGLQGPTGTFSVASINDQEVPYRNAGSLAGFPLWAIGASGGY